MMAYTQPALFRLAARFPSAAGKTQRSRENPIVPFSAGLRHRPGHLGIQRPRHGCAGGQGFRRVQKRKIAWMKCSQARNLSRNQKRLRMHRGCVLRNVSSHQGPLNHAVGPGGIS